MNRCANAHRDTCAGAMDVCYRTIDGIFLNFIISYVYRSHVNMDTKMHVHVLEHTFKSQDSER